MFEARDRTPCHDPRLLRAKSVVFARRSPPTAAGYVPVPGREPDSSVLVLTTHYSRLTTHFGMRGIGLPVTTDAQGCANVVRGTEHLTVKPGASGDRFILTDKSGGSAGMRTMPTFLESGLPVGLPAVDSSACLPQGLPAAFAARVVGSPLWSRPYVRPPPP